MLYVHVPFVSYLVFRREMPNDCFLSYLTLGQGQPVAEVPALHVRCRC